jgi:hypothetical protein
MFHLFDRSIGFLYQMIDEKDRSMEFGSPPINLQNQSIEQKDELLINFINRFVNQVSGHWNAPRVI